ncbi:hypothetical protein COEREDRAFT_84025 [Coemansia reversa NRRL 1564]|uniref:Uncharacterized protein n=1 Tax=Coemansia reversa (strain ATCC 12441 / NRRL 1564) TaxID=763665 RepID=A0A2G5B0N3_COERN|nr:hypothetical protein COEREDRAFT_84025 [Coemansia reversa NRRL 1564]|eukprot:PIA12586.1 hypothetical protein COEREDRAFT_84025 [Coemansia reversa NRRL 1564]
MGILKRIKGSYMFTQMEVGKYTKRRTTNQGSNSPEMVVRPVTTGFVSEFDRAADELRAEQMIEQQRRRQKQLTGMENSQSSETLSNDRQIGRVRSSMDLTSAQRERMDGRTAVSTPQSPESNGNFETVRPRPRPNGRSARSNADMQSVYFAPGRNITTTNQRYQRMSVYPSESSPSLDTQTFDKNSASSTDYYVFTPSNNELSGVALENRRKHIRGIVAPEKRSASQVHRDEERKEAENPSTNPFVERRRRRKASPSADQEWKTLPLNSTFLPDTPEYDGAIDPNHPRKHLNTPVYANQTGTNGLDLLA